MRLNDFGDVSKTKDRSSSDNRDFNIHYGGLLLRLPRAVRD